MSARPRQSLAGLGPAANARQSMAGGRVSLAPAKAPRPSMAGTQENRNSSFGGRRSSVAPRAGGKADPRNFTDKGFKQAAIAKLRDYLMEHGYDRNVTPQMLTAPSVKEFVHIISFLLKATVPNFEFGNKFEDEVPAVLKLLGYPTIIQRGALQSVGAPHAWPPILAALTWLVDLLKYSEAVSDAEGTDGFDDGQGGEKMFFEYLASGYSLFLKGEDDFTALTEQIAFTFESKNSSLNADIKALAQANEELGKEHRGLTEGDSPLEAAKKHVELLKSDQAKFEKHIADLHEHRKKVVAKLEANQGECTDRQSELATLLQQISQHRETIAAQDITPTDVQRMYSEKDHLEAELSQLAKQKDTLSKQLWEEELATSKAIDRLESKVQQANNCSVRLHLIPTGAKNARGGQHEMGLDKSLLATEPSAALSGLDGLVPSLHRVKAAAAEEVAAAQDSLLEAEEGATRREEQQLERQEQLGSLKASLAKLEREEKELRDEHAAELAERKAETERLEEQIRKAKSMNGQEVQQSASELAALQKEHDEFTSHVAVARERMYSQLVSSIDMLTLHKENLEAQLNGLKKHCGAKIDALDRALVLEQQQQQEAMPIA